MRHAARGLAVVLIFWAASAWAGSYPIVDTGQTACFNNTKQMECPEPGRAFSGQDAQYRGDQPAYRDNGDGSVTDLVTGLTWVKARGGKVTWEQALRGAAECRVGGHADWRAPTIKELYSLIDFNGWVQGSAGSSTPFIDIRYFDFQYGNTAKGERLIDCQDWSATKYLGTTMNGNPTAFGVNFADGRIKGYPISSPLGENALYIRYVRGNPNYGRNDLADNQDGTVSDRATGLLWQQTDNGRTYDWEQALEYCGNLTLAGRTDWRLPSAKELQSIVDYQRSPAATGSAALDPVFGVTDQESYFWSSTTHLDGPQPSHAAYVAFGRALGYFAPPQSSAAKVLMDVHGAGAQRSDPKSGDPARFPQGHGPQGDDIRIFNAVRCVAGGEVVLDQPGFVRLRGWQGSAPGGAGSGPGWMSGETAGTGQPEQGRGQMPSQMSGQMSGQMPGQMPGQMSGQNMRPGAAPGPPQEALDACSGKPQGSACGFTAPHGRISGQCRELRGQLACVPEHGPGQPRQ